MTDPSAEASVSAEAVEAAVADWNERADRRIADSPEGHVRACLAAALPHLRAQVLAEVDATLNEPDYWQWYRDHVDGYSQAGPSALAGVAHYLRDTLTPKETP